MQAENICRFTGLLKQFACKTVGNDLHILGTGVLFLPDPEAVTVGQSIPIMAWGETATRLQEQTGSWIGVFGAYTPNEYNGKTYPQFTVGGFKVHNA